MINAALYCVIGLGTASLMSEHPTTLEWATFIGMMVCLVILDVHSYATGMSRMKRITDEAVQQFVDAINAELSKRDSK